MILSRSALLALSLGLLASASCRYEAPLNDLYQPTNSIRGTIIADGIGPDEVGPTFVFVFDAKNPPPPIGTGAPITFTTIPASAFTGDQAGVQSAEYTIPYLPDTTEEAGFAEGFLVTALMDRDGNFNPFADALGGSTCGDALGEHRADLSSPYPVPVFVEHDPAANAGMLLDDVTIHINRTQPFQRPAFTLDDPALTIRKQTAAESLINQAEKTQTYRIRAVGVHTTYPGECAKGDKDCPGLDLDLEGPCAFDPSSTEVACDQAVVCACPPEAQPPLPEDDGLHGVHGCQTGFPVHFIDNFDYTDPDNPVPGPDGLQDPYPSELQAANGLKDTWPRLYLEYMGTPTEDDQGRVVFAYDPAYFTHYDEKNPDAWPQFEWPEGSGRMVNERWVAENYPMALELNFLPASAWVPPGSDPFATFLARGLEITFSPAFRHYHAGGSYDVDPANGPYDLYDLRCYASPDYGDGQFPSGDPDFPHPATCVPGQPVSIEDVPSGAWRLSMITEIGQSWRLPNELGLPARALQIGVDEPLQSTDPSFDISSQGVFLHLVD